MENTNETNNEICFCALKVVHNIFSQKVQIAKKKMQMDSD